MTPIQPPLTDDRLDRLVRQLLTERADDVAAVAMPAETMTAVVASHVRRGEDRRTPSAAARRGRIAHRAGSRCSGGRLRADPAGSGTAAGSPARRRPASRRDITRSVGCGEGTGARLLHGVRGAPRRRRGLHRSQCEPVRQLYEFADLGRGPGREQRQGTIPGKHRPQVDPRRVCRGRCHGLHGAGRSRRPAGLGHAPRRAGTSRRRSRDERCQQRGARRRMHWPVRLRLRVRVLAGRNAPRVRACQPPGRGGLRHGDGHPGRRDRRGHGARRDARERPGRIQRSASLVSGRPATPVHPRVERRRDPRRPAPGHRDLRGRCRRQQSSATHRHRVVCVGMRPGRRTARRLHSRRPSPGSAWTSSASARTSTRTATSTRCTPTARMFGG